MNKKIIFFSVLASSFGSFHAHDDCIANEVETNTRAPSIKPSFSSEAIESSAQPYHSPYSNDALTEEEKTSSRLEVAEQAQSIIFQRKRELVAELREVIDAAESMSFNDEQVKKWAFELEAALNILELYPMGLDYTIVYDAKVIYEKCLKYWVHYSDETKNTLMSIYGLIKKYF